MRRKMMLVANYFDKNNNVLEMETFSGTRAKTMIEAYKLANKITGCDYLILEDKNKLSKFSCTDIVEVPGWTDSFPSINETYNEAQVLIVGTIPSDGGISKGIYYGSSKNGLWKILDEKYHKNNFEKNLSSGNIKAVQKSLEKEKLLFRDVIKWCKRPKNDAKDKDIISARHTTKEEFNELFDKHKDLNKVLCNSEEAFFRFLILMGISFKWQNLSKKDACLAKYIYCGREINIVRVYSPSGIYYNQNDKKVSDDWKKNL